MKISISMLGIGVSVEDDDVTPFVTMEDVKIYALGLLDEVLIREGR